MAYPVDRKSQWFSIEFRRIQPVSAGNNAVNSSSNKSPSEQLQAICQIARLAGDEILDVYESADMSVEQKGDGSPLTLADKRAHELIVRELAVQTPDIPVLSEESNESVMQERKNWNRFWLVDPLDGTKEFVKRNGEFTVNIALIEDRRPVMGVVFVPVRKTLYAGEVDTGAWLTDADGNIKAISVTDYKSGDQPIVVASRSHAGGSTAQYLDNLKSALGEPVVRSMGSSLKICLVAEGEAHVYPRLGLTSEWDTAAAHALVLAAGGRIVDENGEELRYNKDNILNPWFYVLGGGDQDWLTFLDGVDRDS